MKLCDIKKYSKSIIKWSEDTQGIRSQKGYEDIKKYTKNRDQSEIFCKMFSTKCRMLKNKKRSISMKKTVTIFDIIVKKVIRVNIVVS